jgi:hypothetical protein
MSRTDDFATIPVLGVTSPSRFGSSKGISTVKLAFDKVVGAYRRNRPGLRPCQACQGNRWIARVFIRLAATLNGNQPPQHLAPLRY